MALIRAITSSAGVTALTMPTVESVILTSVSIMRSSVAISSQAVRETVVEESVAAPDATVKLRVP